MRWVWQILLGFALWSLATANACAEKRVALVIGNGAYRHALHLPNPSHDAEDVAAALERSGFETITGIDVDQAGMQDATVRFARAARAADVAIFYYSGHAIQYNGVNYLMPVDAKLDDEADLYRMTRVDDILGYLQQARNLKILVLDSCRDNPLAEELKRSIGRTRGASIQRGLAKIESPEGMIIAYATQAGRTANDGDGRNSPFTTAFLRRIEEKEEIGMVFRRVSDDVYETTNQTQFPELSLSLHGEFYLNGKLQVNVTQTTPPTDPCSGAIDHWKSADAIGTKAAMENHLERFPNCAFAGLAKAKLEALRLAALAPQPSGEVSEPAAAAPNQRRHPYDGTWKISLSGNQNCKIRSGAFPMLVENGKFPASNPDHGNVDDSGHFRFTRPSKVNPRITLQFSGKMSGDTGEGNYHARQSNCAGTMVLKRLD